MAMKRLVSGCNEPITCYEYIDQHIKGMKIVYDYYYSLRYNPYINNLLLRWENHRNLCFKLPYLVLALHDIGKVIHQEDLVRTCRAPLHEIASAALAWSVIGETLCNRCKIALTMAILLHHHAMRLPGELLRGFDNYVQKFEEKAKRQDFINNVVNGVASYMDAVTSIYAIPCNIRLINVVDVLRGSFNKVKGLLNNYLKIIERFTSSTLAHPEAIRLRREYFVLYRIVLALLQPLIVTDIISARLQRKHPCKDLDTSCVDKVDEEMLREVVKDLRQCSALAKVLVQKFGVRP